MKRAGRHGKIPCFILSRSFQRLIRNFVSEQVEALVDEFDLCRCHLFVYFVLLFALCLGAIAELFRCSGFDDFITLLIELPMAFKNFSVS
jgi:hypothetical protein